MVTARATMQKDIRVCATSFFQSVCQRAKIAQPAVIQPLLVGLLRQHEHGRCKPARVCGNGVKWIAEYFSEQVSYFQRIGMERLCLAAELATRFPL
jgi:hypothetical protein